MERLLTAYQEDLLSLDELRRRMPVLRQREQALQAEFASLSAQFADQAAYRCLAQTLSAFLGRIRENVQTLDIPDRQRVVRLLVKEVVVGGYWTLAQWHVRNRSCTRALPGQNVDDRCDRAG